MVLRGLLGFEVRGRRERAGGVGWRVGSVGFIDRCYGHSAVRMIEGFLNSNPPFVWFLVGVCGA